jgi:hypothetical protein
MLGKMKTDLMLKLTEDVGRVEGNESVSNDFGHFVNVTGMGPVRVVN